MHTQKQYFLVFLFIRKSDPTSQPMCMSANHNTRHLLPPHIHTSTHLSKEGHPHSAHSFGLNCKQFKNRQHDLLLVPIWQPWPKTSTNQWAMKKCLNGIKLLWLQYSPIQVYWWIWQLKTQQQQKTNSNNEKVLLWFIQYTITFNLEPYILPLWTRCTIWNRKV